MNGVGVRTRGTPAEHGRNVDQPLRYLRAHVDAADRAAHLAIGVGCRYLDPHRRGVETACAELRARGDGRQELGASLSDSRVGLGRSRTGSFGGRASLGGHKRAAARTILATLAAHALWFAYPAIYRGITGNDREHTVETTIETLVQSLRPVPTETDAADR